MDNEQNKSTIAKLLGYLPTAAVLIAIAGIGYWGHRTGWKAPKFSELAAPTTPAEREDWCTEHAVKQSRCIKCNPALVGANAADWCKEHGVAESKCTICHPEILKTGVAADWCREHGLPESSCTLCHPEIAIRGPAPVSATGMTVSLAGPTTAPVAAKDEHDGHDHGPAKSGDAHAGHGDGDGHDHAASGGGHDHTKNPATCQTHNLRVQFASPESVKKAGVKLAQVAERPMGATLTANAEVQYNANKVAKIASPVAGRVWRVEKEAGQAVTAGELIALVDAAEVGKAKAELLQAIAEADLKDKTLKRLKASNESGLRTGAELEEADAAARVAAIRLFNAQQALINLGFPIRKEELPDLAKRGVQFLGLPGDIAGKLDPATTTANLLPLRAPFDGTITERTGVAGELVDPAKPIAVVADTRQMWVTADVPLADARRLKIGQTVAFRPDGAPDHGGSGQISWISTAVDDQTRTVKVRATVDNPDGRLLAQTFGKAAITLRQSPNAVAVPSEAIQWEGCCYITFVRLTDDIFQLRKVKLGAKSNGFTEIAAGLLPGEVIASEGSHVLKSEILKSNLGAGCADEH